MEELMNFICWLMESRYYTEIEKGPVCSRKEWDLDCICTPGEIINQTVNILLNFYDLPEFESDLKFLDDNTVCPIICKKVGMEGAKAASPWFGIQYDDLWEFDINSIKLELCSAGDNGRIYVKIRQHTDMNADRFKQHLTKAQLSADARLKPLDTIGMRKYEFALYMIKRIRSLKNRKMVHFCLLSLALFLAPGNTLKIIQRHLQEKKPGDAEILVLCDFMRIYLDFLQHLQEDYYRTGRIDPNVVSELFQKSWNLDVSQIIAEYVNDWDMRRFCGMIEDSIGMNIRSLKGFRKVAGMLEETEMSMNLHVSDGLIECLDVIKKAHNACKNRMVKIA